MSTHKVYGYQKDYLGSNRVVLDAANGNNVVQYLRYYPFGLQQRECYWKELQPYKYSGKEYILFGGLECSDFGARLYDQSTGRWMCPDPLAEKYYYESPYVYCGNNPMRYVDPDGRAPGDLFKTKDAAAKDWGKYYNGASILRGKEFASTIYIVSIDGKKYFSYSEANEGKYDRVKRSSTPNNESVEAIIHSHGEYLEGYDNNEFSNQDKWNSYNLKAESYLTTPDGSLKKYDPFTTETNIISTDMPSDLKDPGRKNKIEPIDIPLERIREQKRKELDEKPKIRAIGHQKQYYKFFF